MSKPAILALKSHLHLEMTWCVPELRISSFTNSAPLPSPRFFAFAFPIIVNRGWQLGVRG